MIRLFPVMLICCFARTLIGAPADVIGYWQVVDGSIPQSIVVLYEHQDAVHGRMVAIYDESGKEIVETINNPKSRAEGISGNPTIIGLDFLWELKPTKSDRLSGSVIDPDSGRAYKCDVWFDNKKGKLAVCGRLLIFSQTQYWPHIDESNIPKDAKVDPSKFIPRLTVDL